MYSNVSQAPAFDRSPKNGFRCVRYLDRAVIPAVAFAPVVATPLHAYGKETPVSDTVFAVYRDQFSYAPADLAARTEATDDSSPDFLREKVSFTAAYASDRVLAILFLPKKAVPPYQAVIYFPGSGPATFSSRSDVIDLGPEQDFLVKSGRAVVYPVYYGTYERNSIGATGAMVSPTSPYRDAYTEILIKIGRDFRRTVDYLESRGDIDSTRLAYFGLSWGGALGPVMTAIEPRLKASVLYLGGMSANSAARRGQLCAPLAGTDADAQRALRHDVPAAVSRPAHVRSPGHAAREEAADAVRH
jgi:dienelactone hydrolase